MTTRRKLITTAVTAALAAASGGAAASGFALIEQSASGLGNAYAGGAAAAEDASAVFFNPAGLTRVPGRQMVIAGHAIRPSAKFTNNGTTNGVGGAGTGGNGGDAGDWAIVPNFYYAMDINPQWKFGLGINAPFGLKTEYDNGWVGRYHALTSELKTVNINPMLAVKVNDKVSFGFGVSYQNAEAELTRNVDFGTVCFGSVFTPAGCTAAGILPGNAGAVRSDGFFKLDGDDWSWGWNLGGLFQVTPDTRIGVAYRSEVKHTLSGKATFNNPTLPGAFAALTATTATTTGNATADVTLPESFSASFVSRVNPKWEIMGDASWTRWSRFKELRVKFANGAADNVTPENWGDTWRVSFGASYQYSDPLKLRFGIAYDQTPVSDQFRTARIPDEDRIWLAIGGSYKVSPKGKIDFGYAHLFVDDASIRETVTGSGSLRGSYKSDVNILSAQYTHNF